MLDLKITVKETGTTETAKKYDITKDLDGEATLEEILAFTKSSLLRLARESLKEEQAKGFDKAPLVFVDGKKNPNIEVVSPLGKIEYVSKDVGTFEVIEKGLTLLLDKSRIVTGLYFDSHYVFMNGKVVATSIREFALFKDSGAVFKEKDVIHIVNVVPYARRLERLGVTKDAIKTKWRKSTDRWKRSGPNVLAENGVYIHATRELKRQFGRNANIKFTYLTGATIGSTVVRTRDYAGKQLRTHFAKRKREKKSGPYIYPAIEIRLTGGTT